MHLAQLVTLKTILEQGSFTAAAQVIGCSPSAVSLQVKQLEQYFGRPLFDRSSRTVVPTDFAREVILEVGDLSTRLQVLRSRPRIQVAGRVRIGMINSMQSDALPDALRMLRELHPQLEVIVPPLNDSDEMIAELKASRLEAVLVTRPEDGSLKRLVWHEVYRQPYVMLAPRHAPEATPRQLLRHHDWVGYDRSTHGGRIAARHVQMLFADARCTVELRSMDAIVAVVAAGLGVTVIPQPRPALLAAYPIREISLGKRAPFRRLAMAWRKGDDDNRNIQAAVAAFASVFKLRATRQ